MLITIRCPECQIEGIISFIESHYEGPYRCWKCRSLFTIELRDNKLISYEPLSEEELQMQKEAKAIQEKLNRQFPGRS